MILIKPLGQRYVPQKDPLPTFAFRRSRRDIIVNLCDTLTPRTLRKNSTNRLCCRSQWATMIRDKRRPKINMRESWDAWEYHGVMRAMRESCWISPTDRVRIFFLAFKHSIKYSKSKIFFFGGGGQKYKYCLVSLQAWKKSNKKWRHRG